jgi:hypothetical protein
MLAATMGKNAQAESNLEEVEEKLQATPLQLLQSWDLSRNLNPG